jgi:hypothetical protein
MSGASAGLKRFDVHAAVALSLLVQTVMSLLAACVPALAPDIAADRGWNVALVALYPTVLFATAFFVSFGVPHLLKLLIASQFGFAYAFAAAAACILAGPLMLAVPPRAWRGTERPASRQ